MPFLDPQGLMVDDGTVFKLADDHAWVMTNTPEHAGFFAEVTAGTDVEVEEATAAMPNLGLQGPRSRDLLQPLTEVDLSGLRYFRFVPEPVRVGGVPVWPSRTGFGGELGYELFTRPEHAPDLWQVLVAAGARPFGTAAVEICRIEAGLVVEGYDYEPHRRTPFDFSMDRLVALDGPGEFLGKERLRQVAADPPSRFKTLRLAGEEVPEYGATVTAEGEPGGPHQPHQEPPVRRHRPGRAPGRPGPGGRGRRGGHGRGHGAGDRRSPAHLRPREAPPPDVAPGTGWRRAGRAAGPPGSRVLARWVAPGPVEPLHGVVGGPPLRRHRRPDPP